MTPSDAGPRDGTVRLRRALPADAAGVAAAHRQAWVETYTGLLPAPVVTGRGLGEFVQLWSGALKPGASWTTFVCEIPHGPIAGFASAGPIRSPTEDRKGPLDAELIALYLLEEHQGYGLGRVLFEAARADLAERGFARMAVRVLATNTAVGFYAYMGGRTVTAEDRPYRGVTVREVTYGWDL